VPETDRTPEDMEIAEIRQQLEKLRRLEHPLEQKLGLLEDARDARTALERVGKCYQDDIYDNNSDFKYFKILAYDPRNGHYWVVRLAFDKQGKRQGPLDSFKVDCLPRQMLGGKVPVVEAITKPEGAGTECPSCGKHAVHKLPTTAKQGANEVPMTKCGACGKVFRE